MVWLLVLLVGFGSVIFAVSAYLLVRWLGKREPYRHFLQLRTRRKLTFVRLVPSDNRVPFYVKLIPLLLLVYLISPIDLVPDFIPVLGVLDDVVIALGALVLMLKLTSGPLVTDLLQQASRADAVS